MDLKEKIQESYRVLRLGAEISKIYYKKPLIITYSGGKDSDVMLELAKECLDPDQFEVLNSHTTVDAPPTVYHIREVFANLEKDGVKTTIKKPKYKGEPTNMWELIVAKRMPPTRLVRYCCQVLKESNTKKRIISVGVREDESNGRKGRDSFSIRGKTKKEASYWNTEHIEEVFKEAKEAAYYAKKEPSDPDVTDCTFISKAKQSKDIICNPIYYWNDRDIWEYIAERHVKTNVLYTLGYDRVGCIGCPLAGKCKRKKEFYDFPQYKDLYINAFDRMIKKRLDDGLTTKWKTGEEVFRWWMEDENIPGQITIDEYLRELEGIR